MQTKSPTPRHKSSHKSIHIIRPHRRATRQCLSDEAVRLTGTKDVECHRTEDFWKMKTSLAKISRSRKTNEFWSSCKSNRRDLWPTLHLSNINAKYQFTTIIPSILTVYAASQKNWIRPRFEKLVWMYPTHQAFDRKLAPIPRLTKSRFKAPQKLFVSVDRALVFSKYHTALREKNRTCSVDIPELNIFFRIIQRKDVVYRDAATACREKGRDR